MTSHEDTVYTEDAGQLARSVSMNEERQGESNDRLRSVKQMIANNTKLRNQLKTLKISLKKISKQPFLMLYSTTDGKQS